MLVQLVINAFFVNAAAEIADGRQLGLGLFHYCLQGSEANSKYCLVASDGLHFGW